MSCKMALPAFTSCSGLGGSETGSRRVSRSRFGRGDSGISGAAARCGGAVCSMEVLHGTDAEAQGTVVSEEPGSAEGAHRRNMALLEGRSAG